MLLGDIKSIEFGSYLVNFDFTDKPIEMPIHTEHPEVSIAIKQAIRPIAEKKDIPVDLG